MALDTIIFNGTEHSLSGGVSEYKTADTTEWVFTLTAGTTMKSTRITASGETTISGYTTYLIPNANIPVDTGFVKVNGTTYWVGYYTEDDDTRTYAMATGAYYANDSYTGLAVCMQDTNGTLEDITFMYRMSVITTKNTSIDIPGFSGYETDAYLTFAGGSSRVPVYLPVESDKVYAIKFSDFTFYQMCAVKTGTSYFNANSQAKYAIMGDYVIIPSIDGYLAWTMASWEKLADMYASDGLEIFVLDKPWEVHAVSKTVPCRAYVHAGNFKHQVMLAYALGWRGVETDVRTTSDGEFILSHDATLGGLTIADSTYADILAAYPGVMTVDELIEFSIQFNCSIFYHFQNVDADDRWTIMCRSQQFDIDHLGYSLASQGYIGTEAVSTFWKYGYYTWGSATIPDDIAQARYNIGGTYDEDYPQTAYYMQAAENGGTPTNTELSETYKDYFSDMCYLSKHYPIYDAPCKSLELDSTTLTFTASGTKKLHPTPEPICCSEDITWASSDESVATVEASNSANTMFPYATVTAVAEGICTITATCGNMQATCTVSVSGLS